MRHVYVHKYYDIDFVDDESKFQVTSLCVESLLNDGLFLFDSLDLCIDFVHCLEFARRSGTWTTSEEKRNVYTKKNDTKEKWMIYPKRISSVVENFRLFFHYYTTVKFRKFVCAHLIFSSDAFVEYMRIIFIVFPYHKLFNVFWTSVVRLHYSRAWRKARLNKRRS